MAVNGPDNKQASKTNTERVDLDARLLHFARADKLIGSDLRNNSADSIGTVSDFIVDRGSGRIEYAVVKSGDFLGFGGKSIALPYNELRYMATTTSFQTGMTQEQLERRTEFVPENWEELNDRSWMDNASDWFSDDRKNHTEDAIHEAFKNGERERVEGRVTRVERKDYNGDEHVFLTVVDEDEEKHTLVLGPTWYVMGHENAVKRGDDVDFSVVSYDSRYIVADGKINRDRVTFRDANGKSSWTTKNQKNPSRYVLLSDISGMSVEMVGSTVGEVQTTLIEGGSGSVALLALDPNENLFGLGDELSLIPWGAVTLVRDSHVIINGNEAKLNRTLKMPEDIGSMRTPSSVVHAYETFGIEMPGFEARDNRAKNQYGDRDRTTTRHGDAWSNESSLIEALRDGKDVKIEGTFQSFTTQSVVDGAPEAKVMVVRTKDGTRRLIMAPVWFADKQRMGLNKGDSVTINAKRTKFDGREYYSIVSVESGENRWDFWDNNTPAWSK